MGSSALVLPRLDHGRCPSCIQSEVICSQANQGQHCDRGACSPRMAHMEGALRAVTMHVHESAYPPHNHVSHRHPLSLRPCTVPPRLRYPPSSESCLCQRHPAPSIGNAPRRRCMPLTASKYNLKPSWGVKRAFSALLAGFEVDAGEIPRFSINCPAQSHKSHAECRVSTGGEGAIWCQDRRQNGYNIASLLMHHIE